jgi:hypothetical protein
MLKPMTLTVLAATVALTAAPLALTQPANAQVDVFIGHAPPSPQSPRYGAYGDQDRDGIPNRYDRNNNNNNRASNWRDQDNDGIPNRYDTDRDGDGAPDRWDRNPANPHRR